jgi:hypothetical protein
MAHNYPQLHDEPVNALFYEARLFYVGPCLVIRLFIHMRMVDRNISYFLYGRGKLP